MHVAVGFTSCPEAQELIQTRPTAVASMMSLLPIEVDEAIVRPHVPNLAGIFGGKRPLPAQARVREQMAGWGNVRMIDLPADYPADTWSDVIADHAALVVDTITQNAMNGLPAVRLDPSSGREAGIRYQIEGQGPPLLLFPIGLFPTQWDAVRATLREQFTLILLGGVHVGAVKFRESVGANPGYLWGIRGVLARLEIQAGERILDVGTGNRSPDPRPCTSDRGAQLDRGGGH